jgi:SAM-dependent methyltransferase
MELDLAQHNIEIHANTLHWQRKPLLRKIYREFYGEIASLVRRDIAGVTVEIGSGIGNLKTVIPDALATDIFPNPWLDRIENAYALNFPDDSVANLILFDVWHHLEYPGTALAEFHRVLAKGGRLIIFDPGMGLLGRLIYGCFHHEPLLLDKEIQWRAPAGFSPEAMSYYAAQGNAHRVFVKQEFASKLEAWNIVMKKQFAALAYVASGGFRGPQLYPEQLHGAVKLLDHVADLAPGLFATRLLVALEKR